MVESEGLKVYNTLSRSIEEFVPMKDGAVEMFVCGQTVYDDAHLGHAKTYICFDIIARWLRKLGYELTYIQNITDIDDKIIERAKEQGKDPSELAKHFERRFMEDMEAVGVKQNVSGYPRSHDYVEQIRKQIQLLFDRGFAYSIGDDIYFEVDRFPDYTKLSGIRLDELKEHRIDVNERKRKPYDFALWKAAKEGEPRWSVKLSENGKEREFVGRPGWHIEDTAISHAFFGPQYDLHGGARELIFPHHTNEVAQAEAAFGKRPFVRYWTHSGILNIKGAKMSKSLKNFVKIREFLEKDDAEVLRMLICSTHYRKDIDYDQNIVKGARDRLRYLNSSFSIFYNCKEGEDGKVVRHIVDKFGADFTAAMNDDFNTPLALSKLGTAIDDLRNIAECEDGIENSSKVYAIAKIIEFAGTLGLLQDGKYRRKLPEDASALIKERERLRKEKRFEEADRIREELKGKHQIAVEDSEYGVIWYYLT